MGKLADLLAKIAPATATLLGGPAAGAVASMVSSALLGKPDGTDAEIAQALAVDPDAAVKLKSIEADSSVELERIYAAREQAADASAVQNAEQINQTMQAEGRTEHWPQWSWRPYIGFCVGTGFGGVIVIVLVAYWNVIFNLEGTPEQMRARIEALGHIPAMLTAFTALFAMVTPILGVASWFRGRAKADPSVPFVAPNPFRAKKE